MSPPHISSQNKVVAPSARDLLLSLEQGINFNEALPKVGASNSSTYTRQGLTTINTKPQMCSLVSRATCTTNFGSSLVDQVNQGIHSLWASTLWANSPNDTFFYSSSLATHVSRAKFHFTQGSFWGF